LPAFPSWLDCTIDTSGYDFRKGQPYNISSSWLMPPARKAE
jgi:hypothetical protein